MEDEVSGDERSACVDINYVLHENTVLTYPPPQGPRFVHPGCPSALVWAQVNLRHHHMNDPVGWVTDIFDPCHMVATENACDHADRIAPVFCPGIGTHLFHGIHEGRVIGAVAGNRLVSDGSTRPENH